MPFFYLYPKSICQIINILDISSLLRTYKKSRIALNERRILNVIRKIGILFPHPLPSVPQQLRNTYRIFESANVRDAPEPEEDPTPLDEVDTRGGPVEEEG